MGDLGGRVKECGPKGGVRAPRWEEYRHWAERESMGIRWGGGTESRHRARGQEQSMSVREQSRGARQCGTGCVRLEGREYGC